MGFWGRGLCFYWGAGLWLIAGLAGSGARAQGASSAEGSADQLQSYTTIVCQGEIARLAPPEVVRKSWVRRAGRWGWRQTQRAGRVALGLLVLGPGVQMVNSYTGSVVNPLSQTAGQHGARDLAPAAKAIQTVLTDSENLSQARDDLRNAERAARQLEALVDEAERLSPEGLRAQWKQIQMGLFEYYQQFNKALPAHLRDGRNGKEMVASLLLSTASLAAQFDTQYEVHRARWERLKALTELAPDQREEMRYHREQMEAAQQRIATVLADWRLNEILFQEFSSVDPELAERVPLLKLYGVYKESLRFDLYQNQVIRKMRGELAQIGVTLGRFEAEMEEAPTQR